MLCLGIKPWAAGWYAQTMEPSRKLLCLHRNPKNYATHSWHNSQHVWLLGRSSCSSPSTTKELHAQTDPLRFGGQGAGDTPLPVHLVQVQYSIPTVQQSCLCTSSGRRCWTTMRASYRPSLTVFLTTKTRDDSFFHSSQSSPRTFEVVVD